MTPILRKTIALAAVSLAALAAGTTTSTPSQAGDTKLGIVMEARPAEQPWSAAIYDAAQALVAKDPSVKLVLSYKAYDPTSAEPVVRQMIDEGASVVALHSFALNDIAKTLAKAYPKIPMAVSSFDAPIQPNLSISTASYLHIGYSNCWLLAKLSKSGKIAYVGAMPIPYATEILEGCQLGAKAANPKAEVLAAYSNSFSNPQATREQVQGLIDQGADAVFPASATEDSLGGFQLCEQKQLPCAGFASDIRRFAPNYGVSSAIIDWSVLLDSMLAQARSGKLEATTFDASFGNKGLVPQPIDGATAKVVPDDVKAGYLQIVADLAAKKIELPKSKAHPCCE